MVAGIVSAAEKKPFKREVFLSPAIYMFEHADPTDTTNSLVANGSKTKFPEQMFWEWTHRAIDSAWLPTNSPKLVCKSGEFDGRDVIRCVWAANNYKIEVVQTECIFLIKLTPVGSVQKDAFNGDFEKVKNLAIELFAKSGTRWVGGQGASAIVTNLNLNIGLNSLIPTNVFQMSDGGLTIGYPPEYRVGIANGRNAELDKANWFMSQEAQDYWFRNIHWLTDKKSISFFFEKREGISAIATFPNTFSRGLDQNWFR